MKLTDWKSSRIHHVNTNHMANYNTLSKSSSIVDESTTLYSEQLRDTGLVLSIESMTAGEVSYKRRLQVGMLMMKMACKLVSALIMIQMIRQLQS